MFFSPPELIHIKQSKFKTYFLSSGFDYWRHYSCRYVQYTHIHFILNMLCLNTEVSSKETLCLRVHLSLYLSCNSISTRYFSEMPLNSFKPFLLQTRTQHFSACSLSRPLLQGYETFFHQAWDSFRKYLRMLFPKKSNLRWIGNL